MNSPHFNKQTKGDYTRTKREKNRTSKKKNKRNIWNEFERSYNIDKIQAKHSKMEFKEKMKRIALKLIQSMRDNTHDYTINLIRAAIVDKVCLNLKKIEFDVDISENDILLIEEDGFVVEDKRIILIN